MDPIPSIQQNSLKRTRSLTTLDSIIDQVAGCDSKYKRTKKTKKTKAATRKAVKSAIKTAAGASSVASASNGDNTTDIYADNNDLSTSSDEITEANQDESSIHASAIEPFASLEGISSATSGSDAVLMTNVKECLTALVTPLSDNVEVLRNQVQELMLLTQQLSSQINLLMSQSQQPMSLVKSNQPCSQSVIIQPMSSTQGAPSYSEAAASKLHTQGQTRQSRDVHHDAVTAMYVDLDKKQRRTSNIVVSGLSANSSAEEDAKAVIELLRDEYEWDVNEWPGVKIVKVRRLGNKQEKKLQPLLVTLDSQRTAQYYINNAKWLRASSNADVRDNVFINADMTPSEAKAAYELRVQRRQRAQRYEASGDSSQPGSKHRRTIYRSHGATSVTTGPVRIDADNNDTDQSRTNATNTSSAERPIVLQWRQPASSSVLIQTAVAPTGVVPESSTTLGHNTHAPSFIPSTAVSGPRSINSNQCSDVQPLTGLADQSDVAQLMPSGRPTNEY